MSVLNGLHPSQQHVRPTQLNTGGVQVPDDSTPFSQEDQIRKTVDMVRSSVVKIAVISNGTDRHQSEQYKHQVTCIATELNKLLSGSKALVYEYEITNHGWLNYLRSVKVDYFIFVGLPPYVGYTTTKTAEEEFFNPKSIRITQVVVVRKEGWDKVSTPGGTRITAYTPVHYLTKFLHLDGSDYEIAVKALGHFSVMPPIPYPEDKAFWSQWPKVIQVHKNQSSLGLSIMTREMAPKSSFPRIVLVKSSRDCMKELKDRIGKYTHIQSFNGILLDGLDISKVTEIVQASSLMSDIQLLVRYVHPLRTTTNTAGLTGDITTITTPITPSLNPRPPADRINPLNETFPIPLMILGDIPKPCKELFKHLSAADSDSQTSASAGFADPAATSTATTSLNSFSALKTSSRSTTSLHVPQRTKSVASCSSYNSNEGSNLGEYSALSQSDKYVMRATVPHSLFNSNAVSPITPIHNIQSNPPSLSRHLSTYPGHSVEKRYIINMFTNWEEDRKFSHLFLRESGLYLVVVSMEELMEDPAIQFENLLFWLRLVQTYVGPNEIRRVIIVGMSDTSMSSGKEKMCLEHLEGAIREAELQHIYVQNESSVLIFDRQNVKASLDSLCQRISRCMDLLMNRTWYMYKPFFYNVFQPFTGLTEVLSCISRSKDIVMSSDSLLSVYRFADPNYFDTLAAYSSACISVTDRLESLLEPGFLIDLLKKLSLKSEMYKESFYHHVPLLKNLPIVPIPWPLCQIATIDNSLASHHRTSIIKWAERYELLFSLGYHGNHEVYFIPLLATEFLGEDSSYEWLKGDEEDHWYNKTDVNILYALLKFSALDFFFFSLLTEILKDVVNGVQQHSSYKCYIKIGCMEAIMPVHVPDVNSNINVYLKYHRLQNVVEFRTSTKVKPFYLYKAVNSKLHNAFDLSKYSKMDISRDYKTAITFHTKSDKFDPSLVSSSIGRLCGLRSSSQRPDAIQSDGEEMEHDQFLKMKPVSKDWESSTLEMKKKIPAEYYLRWGRCLSSDTHNWALVGSKLNLLTREEVDYFRTNPEVGGNGGLIFSRWSESTTLTYRDLTRTLRSSEVGLETLAADIESYFCTDGTDV